MDAKEFVPGAEVLLETENTMSDDDSGNSDEEWINVNHSENENDSDEDIDDADDEHDEETVDIDEEEGSVSDKTNMYEPNQSACTYELSITNKTIQKNKVVTKKEQLAEKKEKAAQVSSTRILTDEDFKRIEIAQLNKQMTSAKRKRTAEPDISSR